MQTDPHALKIPVPGPNPLTSVPDDETIKWAEFLRQNLTALFDETRIDPNAYSAPRRKARNVNEAKLAQDIAQLLYPSPADSILPALIKYEKDITLLRRMVLAERAAAEMERALDIPQKPTPREQVTAQGPWDEVDDPLSLNGVSSLPMPVQVSSRSSLEPFFKHLRDGGDYKVSGEGKRTEELYYGVEMGEWEKGMLYRDGRMDLCKMVVGPPHIGSLMDSLESNTFVRHFLLGNNIIGPTGAKRIASYLSRHPNNQMETWYLAGNCIDTSSLELLVRQWTNSSTITNIWLKRNPLGPSSIESLYELITETPQLQTLDLDQTELSDGGVAKLFDMLTSANKPALPLRNMYLNANGISVTACKSIAEYLATPNCRLESLYISNNPIGDQGALALAHGLEANSKLQRLSIRSCGLKNTGAIAIMNALSKHQNIMSLDISQSYATEDLGSRYNFFDDEIKDPTIQLMKTSQSLRLLNFGITGMTIPYITALAIAVSKSHLLVFKAESIHDRLTLELRQYIRARLTKNVKATYGPNTTYGDFEEGEQRWLISPKDVRFIDSGYRNRDMGLARRGLKILNKHWEDADELLRIINHSGVS
ncbi:MAG: hypothetical protein Q9171_001704 [Xanthocarpia ochracea]